jgi:hypothetical protein
MQEASDSIKRPNMRIMGIENVEEVQAKWIHNIFNKIITENFSNFKKICPIRYWKPPGCQTDLTKIAPLHSIIIKTTGTPRVKIS